MDREIFPGDTRYILVILPSLRTRACEHNLIERLESRSETWAVTVSGTLWQSSQRLPASCEPSFVRLRNGRQFVHD